MVSIRLFLIPWNKLCNIKSVKYGTTTREKSYLSLLFWWLYKENMTIEFIDLIVNI